MHSYIFQLGRNFLLSSAEIFSLLDALRIPYTFKGNSSEVLLIDTPHPLDTDLLQSSLGGTIAIGELENIVDRKTARKIKREKGIINANYKEEKVIGSVIASQDVESYKVREFDKPYFDTKSGQISAKLAQMMVNLSLSSITQTIYDPFCATGTVNIEASRLGFHTIGSDINPEAVHGARENLHWYHKILREQTGIHELPSFHFFISDIKDAAKQMQKREFHADTIVTEGYLGKPRTALLDMHKQTLKELDTLNTLVTLSLKEYTRLVKPGNRVVTVIPAFRTKQRTIVYLPVREKLQELGYRIPSLFKEEFDFEGKKNRFLVFRRGAVVLREIFVLEVR